MTQPRISVDDDEQRASRGTSSTSLTDLANGLPKISSSGIRTDHAEAAKGLVKKAKDALRAASATNSDTAKAAIRQVATDVPIARDVEHVAVPAGTVRRMGR